MLPDDAIVPATALPAWRSEAHFQELPPASLGSLGTILPCSLAHGGMRPGTGSASTPGSMVAGTILPATMLDDMVPATELYGSMVEGTIFPATIFDGMMPATALPGSLTYGPAPPVGSMVPATELSELPMQDPDPTAAAAAGPGAATPGGLLLHSALQLSEYPATHPDAYRGLLAPPLIGSPSGPLQHQPLQRTPAAGAPIHVSCGAGGASPVGAATTDTLPAPAPATAQLQLESTGIAAAACAAGAQGGVSLAGLACLPQSMPPVHAAPCHAGADAAAGFDYLGEVPAAGMRLPKGTRLLQPGARANPQALGRALVRPGSPHARPLAVRPPAATSPPVQLSYTCMQQHQQQPEHLVALPTCAAVPACVRGVTPPQHPSHTQGCGPGGPPAMPFGAKPQGAACVQGAGLGEHASMQQQQLQQQPPVHGPSYDMQSGPAGAARRQALNPGALAGAPAPPPAHPQQPQSLAGPWGHSGPQLLLHHLPPHNQFDLPRPPEPQPQLLPPHHQPYNGGPGFHQQPHHFHLIAAAPAPMEMLPPTQAFAYPEDDSAPPAAHMPPPAPAGATPVWQPWQASGTRPGQWPPVQRLHHHAQQQQAPAGAGVWPGPPPQLQQQWQHAASSAAATAPPHHQPMPPAQPPSRPSAVPSAARQPVPGSIAPPSGRLGRALAACAQASAQGFSAPRPAARGSSPGITAAAAGALPGPAAASPDAAGPPLLVPPGTFVTGRGNDIAISDQGRQRAAALACLWDLAPEEQGMGDGRGAEGGGRQGHAMAAAAAQAPVQGLGAAAAPGDRPPDEGPPLALEVPPGCFVTGRGRHIAVKGLGQGQGGKQAAAMLAAEFAALAHDYAAGDEVAPTLALDQEPHVAAAAAAQEQPAAGGFPHLQQQERHAEVHSPRVTSGASRGAVAAAGAATAGGGLEALHSRGGFVTGTGKVIAVSDAARQRAAHLASLFALDSQDDDDDDKVFPPTQPVDHAVDQQQRQRQGDASAFDCRPAGATLLDAPPAGVCAAAAAQQQLFAASSVHGGGGGGLLGLAGLVAQALGSEPATVIPPPGAPAGGPAAPGNASASLAPPVVAGSSRDAAAPLPAADAAAHAGAGAGGTFASLLQQALGSDFSDQLREFAEDTSGSASASGPETANLLPAAGHAAAAAGNTTAPADHMAGLAPCPSAGGPGPGPAAAAAPGAGRIVTGFHTARGDGVTVSAASIAAARAKLATLELQEQELLPPQQQQQQAAEEGVAAAVGQAASAAVSAVPGASSNNLAASGRVATGFSTGNGRSVTVSARSMEAARARLAALEQQQQEACQDAAEHGHLEAPAGTAPALPETPALPALPDARVATGFSTGGGRPVTVSAAQMAAAKAKMAAVLAPEPEPAAAAAAARGTAEVAAGEAAPAAPAPAGRVITGFSTGNGAAVTVTAASMVAAKAKLAALEQEQQPAYQGLKVDALEVAEEAPAWHSTSAQGGAASGGGIAPDSRVATGFSTGGGKAVTVYAASMAAAKAKMAALDHQQQMEGGEEGVADAGAGAGTGASAAPAARVNTGFSTGAGKAGTVSAAQMAAAKAKMAAMDLQQPQQQHAEEAVAAAGPSTSAAAPDSRVATGFSTRGGKAVTVSVASMAAAKAKMDALAQQQEQQAQKEAVAPTGPCTSGVDAGSIAAPAPAPAGRVNTGFSTGGGKAVSVSAAQMAAAKAKMAALERQQSAQVERMEGAEAAAGSTAAVSIGRVPTGFSTGGGKAVTVSAAQMEAAKARMAGIDAEAANAPADDAAAGQQPQPWLPPRPPPADAGCRGADGAAAATAADAAAPAADSTTASASAAAAAASAAATPLRRPAAGAPASAASTPLAGAKRDAPSLAATPAACLPVPSTAGLKRPRITATLGPAVGGGNALAHTRGKGPAARDATTPSGVTAATAGSVRPAGATANKFKPPSRADRTLPPATGGRPASASGVPKRKFESPMGAAGSPKRPRRLSMASTRGGSGKVPLHAYFLEPAPAGPMPRLWEGVHAHPPQQAAATAAAAAPAFEVANHAPAAVADISMGVDAAAPTQPLQQAADEPLGRFVPLPQHELDRIGPHNSATVRFWLLPLLVASTALDVAAASSGANDGRVEHPEQQQQQQQGDAELPALHAAHAVAGASSGTGTWWGVAEAHAALLAEAAPSLAKRCSEAWVANHYRWVVWKLAAYERKFPAMCGGGRALSPATVMQQLRHRWQVEVLDGCRPALSGILAKDRPAGAPMVLVITHMPPVEPGSEGLRIEVSDGWYCVRAVLDKPLMALAARGRMQVGAKLRVTGADLLLNTPGEPLEACREASLLLHYNGTSPACWDAPLGMVPPPPITLRPLGQVLPDGGTVPATLVLLVSKYSLRFRSQAPSGRWVMRTQRAQEEHERGEASRRQQAEVAAAREAAEAEVQHCRQLLRKPAASRAECAYASLTLHGDAGCGGDEGGMAPADRAQLERLVAEGQARIANKRQLLMDQHAAAAAGPSGASNGSGCGGRGAEPLLRLLVSAVTPQSERFDPCCALLRVSRPSPVLDELAEGCVLLVSDLQPSTFQGGVAELGHGAARVRLQELRASAATKWRPLGSAGELSHLFQLQYRPRPRLELSAISASLLPGTTADGAGPSAHAHAAQQQQQQQPPPPFLEFDFNGVVVFVGEPLVMAGGTSAPPIVRQHVFLADHTSGLCGATLPAHNGGGAAGPGRAWLLAVRIEGAQGSVDLLDACKDTGALMACRHLLLESMDAPNQLWVAAAGDTASMARLPAGSAAAGSSALAAWARGEAGQQQVALYGRKVGRIVNPQ